jgi:hypothetical protein
VELRDKRLLGWLWWWWWGGFELLGGMGGLLLWLWLGEELFEERRLSDQVGTLLCDSDILEEICEEVLGFTPVMPHQKLQLLSRQFRRTASLHKR